VTFTIPDGLIPPHMSLEQVAAETAVMLAEQFPGFACSLTAERAGQSVTVPVAVSL
jgi:hypothetical protein